VLVEALEMSRFIEGCDRRQKLSAFAHIERIW